MSKPSRSKRSRAIRAELHTHTTYSDGEYSPLELYHRCVERGVSLWSITDHDTCQGALSWIEQSERWDEPAALDFLPGVEISARDERSVHVLGYGLKARDPALQELFAARSSARAERMAMMVERANQRGFAIAMSDVARHAEGGSSLARPHLARALVAGGYAASLNEAFNRYLSEGGPLYVSNAPTTVAEAIAIIHRFGGVALIAHPGTSRRDERLASWVEQGLDGLECHHPSHSPELAAHYEGLARRFELLISASSDFHGPSVAPERELGRTTLSLERVAALRERVASRGGLWLEREAF